MLKRKNNKKEESECQCQCTDYSQFAQLDRHQTCKPVMVSCKYNSHWKAILFFKTPQCYFCTKMTEMSDLCYLRKLRIEDIVQKILKAKMSRNEVLDDIAH